LSSCIVGILAGKEGIQSFYHKNVCIKNLSYTCRPGIVISLRWAGACWQNTRRLVLLAPKASGACTLRLVRARGTGIATALAQECTLVKKVAYEMILFINIIKN
jgi:hypothetical protein